MGPDIIGDEGFGGISHPFYIPDGKGQQAQQTPTDRGLDILVAGFGVGGSGPVYHLALCAGA